MDGTIDASAGYVYTTTGGANIFSTGTGVVNVTAGTQTKTYQLVQNTGYTEIPLTPVKLKNSDGSYLQSSTKSYTYTEGFWRCTNAEHVYTDVVTPPTCTDKGYTTHTCSVCGKVAVDNYVDALGHNYVDEIVAPTCENGGYTKHTCSNCGDSYIDSETAALGHSYEEKIITEPTCTETGLKEYTCTACSDSYTEPIASNDHDLEETIYAPTCTEAGKTVYSCKNCDYVLEEPGEPANGHSWSGWEVVANAGCEAAGEEKRTCSSCNAVETRVVEATGHSYSLVVTAPTCTEQGYTTYTCSTCSHSYIDNYVGALGHSYNSVVTAPTCLDQGYTTHTCSVCDNVVVDTYVDALGHDYDAVVTAPTCTEQGYTTYTCHCGETYVNDYVAATGHSMGDWIIDTPADCVNKGIKHAECADCDYTEKEEIPAIGHSYEAEVTAPTCTAEGYTTYTCHCGDSYVDNYVSALGHSHEAEVTAPTCTAEGYTTYTCHCGDSYVDNYVAALGHSYGEWEVEKDATHTEEGVKSHSCENCGDVESEAIPVIICDIDNDGIVNSTELAKMRQYLIGKTTITETETLLMDMDDNGTVNIVDLFKLKKYIAANVTVTE